MIESLYPGVFVSEVPFNAKPIDGVSTSTTALRAAAYAVLPNPPAPQWTDRNSCDPGVTQLELLCWLADGLLARTGLGGHAARRDHAQRGVGAGLAVDASVAGAAPAVSVSPGLAIGSDGRSVDFDSALLVHRDPEP
jgi:hypothetical protein